MTPTLLDRLLMIVELFQRDMARAFAGTPLTQARVGVLWVLQTRGPSTQQTIARALDVTARNVSALVDALSAAGYVRRTPHPEDRRAVLVRLTPSAETMMSAMERDHTALAEQLRRAVAPDDLPAFERGVDAVVARLRRLVADGRGPRSDDAHGAAGQADAG